jgi:hypothetical protein
MNKKEILETIERLEIYRFDNVYTYEQLEKDKMTLNKLKEKLTLTDVGKRSEQLICNNNEQHAVHYYKDTKQKVCMICGEQ